MATLVVILELDDFAMELTKQGLNPLGWHNLAHAMGQAFENATRMQTITVTLSEMKEGVIVGKPGTSLVIDNEIVKVERA